MITRMRREISYYKPYLDSFTHQQIADLENMKVNGASNVQIYNEVCEFPQR